MLPLVCVLELDVFISLPVGAEVVGAVGVTLGEVDVVLSLEVSLSELSFPLLLLLSVELLSALSDSPLSSSFTPVAGSLVLGFSGDTVGSLGSAGVVGSVGIVVSSSSLPSVSGPLIAIDLVISLVINSE